MTSGQTFLLSIQSLKSLSILSSWDDVLATRSITHGGGYWKSNAEDFFFFNIDYNFPTYNDVRGALLLMTNRPA